MKKILNALLLKKQASKAKARGFTAIEIGVVLAIILIAAAILVPILNGYFASSNVNNEISALRATVNKIDSRYARETITVDLDNTEVIEANLLSDSYRTNAAFEIFNVFDGQVTIDGVDDNGLVVVENSIPSNVCGEFVNAGRELGFDLVDIGGAEDRYTNYVNSTITAACVAGAVDDVITITFTREER